MTTLKDVARAAGVSVASASRAIQTGRVSPELHARIMTAAERLGYCPNLAARALASRRSGLIGLVLSDFGDALLTGVAVAAERALANRGYDALLVSDPGAAGPAATAQALLARRVEGTLFLGRVPVAEEVEAFRAQAVPWCAVTDADEDAVTVDIGRSRAAELACQYLLELGHRRIAVLTRPGGRTSGIARLLEARDGTTLALWSGRGDPASTGAAVQSILGSLSPPTAILCASDAQALAVVRECHLRRIGVPEDISIVGFGDESFARSSCPALTTIRVPVAELGAGSVALLLSAVAGAATRMTRASGPRLKLIVRETTGPARPEPVSFHVERSGLEGST